MERIFYAAASNADVEGMTRILRNNPNFDVNGRYDGNWTALIEACAKGHDSIVSLLLAHPDIDVNLKSRVGATPLSYACGGSTSCVRLLLKDSRVKVNEPDKVGYTPLLWAVTDSQLDIIKWWIASGREMDLGRPGDPYKTDAIGVARRTGKQEVVTLLERFRRDSAQTRHAVRVELGLLDEAAAEVFALVVFVSDGLLQVKDTTPSPAARFFSIVAQLPLELQMVLCYRVVGSPKEIIPGKESEAAFKELARRLVWSSFFTD